MAVGDRIYLSDIVDIAGVAYRPSMKNGYAVEVFADTGGTPKCLDTSYVYSLYGTNLKKYSRATKSLVASLNLSEALSSLRDDTNYIYCRYSNSAKVDKIDKATMTIIGTYTATGNVSSIAIDSTHIYCGLISGVVEKIAIGTMTKIASYTGYGDVRRIAVDNTHIYTQQLYSNTRLVKVNKATMTELIYIDTTGTPQTADMIVHNGLLIAGDVRNISDLTQVHSQGLIMINNFSGYSLDGNIAYRLANSTVTPTITKLNITTGEILENKQHYTVALSLVGDALGMYASTSFGLGELVNAYEISHYRKVSEL